MWKRAADAGRAAIHACRLAPTGVFSESAARARIIPSVGALVRRACGDGNVPAGSRSVVDLLGRRRGRNSRSSSRDVEGGFAATRSVRRRSRADCRGGCRLRGAGPPRPPREAPPARSGAAGAPAMDRVGVDGLTAAALLACRDPSVSPGLRRRSACCDASDCRPRHIGALFSSDSARHVPLRPMRK